MEVEDEMAELDIASLCVTEEGVVKFRTESNTLYYSKSTGGTAAPVPAFTDRKPVSETTAPGDGARAVKQEEWSGKTKEGENA